MSAVLPAVLQLAGRVLMQVEVEVREYPVAQLPVSHLGPAVLQALQLALQATQV